jgi:hypothetical protein
MRTDGGALRRLEPRRDGLGLLALPPPYRCWVAISNDPDATTMREWEAVHRLVWEELALPIADSVFLFNHSARYPDQVCVERHPEILAAHPHDTLHTWGDFCETTTHVFTRDDAVRGLALLREHGLAPRVWVDHANFAGNLLHNAVYAAAPTFSDASGHESANLVYTLDLIAEAGVRYVWDGTLTRVVGQDRPLGRREWYARTKGDALLWAAADVLGRPLWRRVAAQKFDYDPAGNRPWRTHRFPDGRSLYAFRRYGRWALAEIDGLGSLLAPEAVDELSRVSGTMIAYTHLGKRPADRASDPHHVPPRTADALRDLARRHREGEVMVSSVSRLLDYLVLRDHAVVADGRLDLRPDGLRFTEVGPAALAGLEFGLAGRTGRLEVRAEGVPIAADVRAVGDDVWRVAFPAASPGVHSTA